MKLLKMAIFVMAAFSTLTVATISPVKALAAVYGSPWRLFWDRVLNILLKALEMYLETVIRRGYFRVSMPAAPIINVFSNEVDAAMAAKNGLLYQDRTLTVPQDIVIYTEGDVGVALQKGEYEVDGAGNFQFNLIKVLKPVSSPTFPISDGGE
jgi:hypothetical protein